jgi:hypothetical protein
MSNISFHFISFHFISFHLLLGTLHFTSFQYTNFSNERQPMTDLFFLFSFLLPFRGFPKVNDNSVFVDEPRHKTLPLSNSVDKTLSLSTPLYCIPSDMKHVRAKVENSRKGDFLEVTAPLGLLPVDLLLNIYSRLPRLVVAHSRVCKYFYKVLASCSRIHIQLSVHRPYQLTKSFARFVKGSHQSLGLVLNDCTALSTLISVLQSDSTRASIVYLEIGSQLLSPYRLLSPVDGAPFCRHIMRRLELQQKEQRLSKSTCDRRNMNSQTLASLVQVAACCRGLCSLRLDGLTAQEVISVLQHAPFSAANTRRVASDQPPQQHPPPTAGWVDMEEDDNSLSALRRNGGERAAACCSTCDWRVSAASLALTADTSDKDAGGIFSALARLLRHPLPPLPSPTCLAPAGRAEKGGGGPEMPAHVSTAGGERGEEKGRGKESIEREASRERHSVEGVTGRGELDFSANNMGPAGIFYFLAFFSPSVPH